MKRLFTWLFPRSSGKPAAPLAGRPAKRGLIFLAAGAATLGLAVSASTLDTLEISVIPENFETQSDTTKLIYYLIEKGHFKNTELDDRFSGIILDKYIQRLDPARHFFLQSDLDQFERFRHQFDDYIKQGILDPVFAIFKIYRLRVDERIEYALQRLDEPFDFSLDETFLIDPEQARWAKSKEEMEDTWRRRIKNDILNLRLAGKPEAGIAETLGDRYTHIARRTRQLKTQDIFKTFINAYVTSVEPHTNYYSPRGAENFKIHMRLSLEGIGAVLQTENEYTIVRRIIPGGPADLSEQLHAEDRIVGVGQEGEEIRDIIGWRVDDVVELIRGPKASIVHLEILRAEDGLDGEPVVVTLKRDEIKLEDQAAKKGILQVDTEAASARIGIIRLPSFYGDLDSKNVNDPDYRSTTRDVQHLLGELEQAGIDGLVIDLRGNGGGALTEAITLTGLFIETGPIVQVKNASGKVRITRDPDPGIIYDGPLMVLVDHNSASASEIFAGAIQDYNRGLVVGESTFGKGTVQNLVDLNRIVETDADLGQLKITVAQFFRINGDSTQYRGVIPDFTWHTTRQETDTGERAFENALPWSRVEETPFVPYQAKLTNQSFTRAINAHHARVANQPEFNYFLDINRFYRENRKRDFVTLNQKQRRLNREQRDRKRLALENSRRKALGQTLFSDIHLLDEDEEHRIRSAEMDGFDSANPDVFLTESAKILVDFNHFANHTNPDSTLVELAGQKNPSLNPKWRSN
ncbi:MAG: carboxy terminal-processing peptidase [Gammaproteobacteria bacterium]|nr:carboxy terminal-processing peptidase [Gammaproteobacteria bacterium]